MYRIEMTGSPSQQVFVYDVTIRKNKNGWQVRYKYDGEVGSFLVKSLSRAQAWCKERQLTFNIVD